MQKIVSNRVTKVCLAGQTPSQNGNENLTPQRLPLDLRAHHSAFQEGMLLL